MDNTSPQSTIVRNSSKEFHPALMESLDDPVVENKDRELSDQDVLVREILESTRCIRRRTDNREILAILDEIAWLARSI